MTFALDRRRFLMGTTALLAPPPCRRPPRWRRRTACACCLWGGQARADRTYAATDLYSKANPGTAFDGEFMAFNDYWTKLGTQVAGGNAPDILQMDYRYIVEYANRNAIAAARRFRRQGTGRSDFDADQLEGGKVNGKLYGISLGANSVATIVNVAALQEAGLDAPGPELAYEDLPALAEKFNSANKRPGMKLWSDNSVSSRPSTTGFARRARGSTARTASRCSMRTTWWSGSSCGPTCAPRM